MDSHTPSAKSGVATIALPLQSRMGIAAINLKPEARCPYPVRGRAQRFGKPMKNSIASGGDRRRNCGGKNYVFPGSIQKACGEKQFVFAVWIG